MRRRMEKKERERGSEEEDDKIYHILLPKMRCYLLICISNKGVGTRGRIQEDT